MNSKSLFPNILANTALAGFTNMLIWFAITFWLYLETRSVFVTGMLGGIYTVLNLFGGIWFGSLVDHHYKKPIMIVSSVTSLLFYFLAFTILILSKQSDWTDMWNPWLWILTLVTILGVVAGNIRMIALSTLVTLLIPEGERDKANGKIGTINGLVFTVVSVFSGIIIGQLGMDWALGIGLVSTLFVIIHLLSLTFPLESHLDNRHDDDKNIDLKGTIRIIAGISGLFAMIFFAMFNNFLGGVFMSLMDAYGLSIVSVEIWGTVLALTSIGFILGGMIVGRYGLGKNPVKTVLLGNLIIWMICILFPIISSIWIVGISFFFFMLFSPIIESAEQTVMQKVVPIERQGRVFGFGQSVENIASPVTAFLIGPLTQFLVIPWIANGGMTGIVGDWWGTSPDRAMAVVFILAGLIGLIVTLFAFTTKSYRDLSHSYQE
ncbi:MFS transporter [Candidatus Gracilibacteria bacterium]|nr:MFS transporter [Candidatus Gracilibacteria bacterium]